MELTKKDRTIKYALYCLVIVAAALLQNTGGLFPVFGGARCFLLVPVAVLLGLNEDEGVAAALGFFAGLLWDVTAAQHKGFNCIFLMLVCYVSAATVVFIFRNTFWLNIIWCTAATLMYCLLYWLLFVVGKGGGAGYVLGVFYFPSAVYTILASPLLFIILKPLKTRLNKVQQVEE